MKKWVCERLGLAIWEVSGHLPVCMAPVAEGMFRFAWHLITITEEKAND